MNAGTNKHNDITQCKKQQTLRWDQTFFAGGKQQICGKMTKNQKARKQQFVESLSHSTAGQEALSPKMRWHWDTTTPRAESHFSRRPVQGLGRRSWRHAITLSQPAATGTDPHLMILVCRCSHNDMSKRLLWGRIQDAGADACHSLLAAVPTANCRRCAKEKNRHSHLAGHVWSG